MEQLLAILWLMSLIGILYANPTYEPTSFESTACPEKCLCVLDTLHPRVYCNYRKLDVIPDNIPTSTDLLYLQLNNFIEIPDHAFQHLENLTFVTASNNKIQSLAAHTFQSNSKLTSIDLKNNEISTISPQAFDSLINLVSLNLRFNKITELSSLAFKHLHNLRTLILFNNAITRIAPDAFDGLDSLTNLYLTNNNIHTLPDNVFSSLKNLKELHLDGNPMQCCHVQAALGQLIAQPTSQLKVLRGTCMLGPDLTLDISNIYSLVCPVVISA